MQDFVHQQYLECGFGGCSTILTVPQRNAKNSVGQDFGIQPQRSKKFCTFEINDRTSEPRVINAENLQNIILKSDIR